MKARFDSTEAKPDLGRRPIAPATFSARTIAVRAD
jgi:hypothetical protein